MAGRAGQRGVAEQRAGHGEGAGRGGVVGLCGAWLHYVLLNTHLQLGTDGMPLWLNEGLAEFFQNTDIRDKDVLVGQPSPDNIIYLRQHRLIPLPMLFQVDATSPYYHEEEKGSVFYAESWALTHYLEVTNYNNHTDQIGAYTRLAKLQIDPVTAAEQAFGDLKKLQAALEIYIGARDGICTST